VQFDRQEESLVILLKMFSQATNNGGFPHAATRVCWWPHRLGAFVAAAIVMNALFHHRLGDGWPMLGITLLPFVILEFVGHVPSTRGTKLIFFVTSLCLSAAIVFYAPMFWRGSGEWDRLAFLLIPALQIAGAVVLALVLTILKLVVRRS
jgi:hypothetical protein